MTTSTNEYANLAAISYRENLRIGDDVATSGRTFEVIDSASSLMTGFSATTFRAKGSHEIVIAFRGTDDPVDGMVDALMVGKRVHLQAIESELYTAGTLSRAMPRGTNSDAAKAVSVTGHSLGGGLAQLNAEKFGLKGETFNAYGIVGLVGHDRSGGSQMINHVRATDLVSAASEHFGDVRIYATDADIRALKSAGFDRHQDHSLGEVIAAASIEAHYMDNFDEQIGNPSIANEVTSQRYEDNKAAVDNFRHELLSRRTMLTSNLSEPSLLGTRVLNEAAANVVTTAAGHALYSVAQAANDIQHVREAGQHALNVLGSVMETVRNRFADPHVATALGSATFSAPAFRPATKGDDIRDKDHAGNALYTQAYGRVSEIDRGLGRAPDESTEKLGGAVTVAATRAGLSRIDHVVLNGDGTKAYGVQGDFSSPHKSYVEVNTAQAMNTPIDQSSREWHAASLAQQSDAHSQQATQTQGQTPQAAILPHGP